MNKKTKVIIASILVVLVIAIVFVVTNIKSSNNGNNDKIEDMLSKEKVDLEEVFDTEELDTSNYTIKNNVKIDIASKYEVGKNKNILGNIVEVNDVSGKMIYVREENKKLNVFQTDYQIDGNDDINMQITQIMEDFRHVSDRLIRAEINEENISTKLYGETKEEHEIPLSESIYFEKRLYSETYVVEENKERIENDVETEEIEIKTYDINYYMNGDKLTCELVYVIK